MEARNYGRHASVMHGAEESGVRWKTVPLMDSLNHLIVGEALAEAAVLDFRNSK